MTAKAATTAHQSINQSSQLSDKIKQRKRNQKSVKYLNIHTYIHSCLLSIKKKPERKKSNRIKFFFFFFGRKNHVIFLVTLCCHCHCRTREWLVVVNFSSLSSSSSLSCPYTQECYLSWQKK